jgi:hypothetical protein
MPLLHLGNYAVHDAVSALGKCRQARSDLLSLDGKVNRADGKPLRICIPTPAPTPRDLFSGDA